MTDLAKPGDVYKFGQFKADASRGELEKAGTKIRLQEKPFRVLMILLENADQVVSREELRNRLWPADTFVEFDDGLNAAVKKLRIALGDSPDQPRFVETVPRRGYRFIAPVKREAVQVAPEATAQATANISQPKPSYSRIWTTAAVVAGLCIVIATSYALRLHSGSTNRQIRSVAVLPLENLSHDEEQAFFADGITDELITDLAKTGALRVISRTSVMHYKDSRKSVPEIARELNVDAVVEGTVSRSDSRVLIRAQLIKAEPEEHIWAESYDRPRGDLVELQGELARDIAEAIRVKLLPKQEEEFARERSADPEAHELYLKGRYFWNKRNQESNRKAFEYFRKAIAKDPNYAQGYAGLADAYAFSGTDLPIHEAAMKSREMALRALSLDDQLAEAHATLGLIAPQFGWDWQEVDRQLKRAIELNPGFATAFQWHAEVYLVPMGRTNEAIEEMRKAEQLDPLSPIIATDLGKLLYYARRYDEAETQLKKALELDPEFGVARGLLGAVYFEQRRYAEMQVELERSRPMIGNTAYLSGLIALHAKTGRLKLAKQEMNQLLQIAHRETVDPGEIASRYVLLGDKDNAFAWLDKACTSGSGWAGTINANATWDPLHSDPRFNDVRRCLHLSN